MAPTLKNKHELQKMRHAGRIVGDCHLLLREAIRPGVTTGQLNRTVHEYIVKQGAVPSFLGYGHPTPYPAATCISVNDQVIHGIPGVRVLREGDIVSIDIGVIWQGYHGDSAWSYAVGDVTAEARRLLNETERALYHALEYARSGQRLGDIGHAIQSYAEEQGYGVIRQYTSHGIGRALHEDPELKNYGPPGKGLKLCAGMTLAVEPMVTQHSYETRELNDGWTVVTVDGGLAAHFEHTIAITPDNGPEILTRQERSQE